MLRFSKDGTIIGNYQKNKYQNPYAYKKGKNKKKMNKQINTVSVTFRNSYSAKKNSNQKNRN